jgi:hypothetical protein
MQVEVSVPPNRQAKPSKSGEKRGAQRLIKKRDRVSCHSSASSSLHEHALAGSGAREAAVEIRQATSVRQLNNCEDLERLLMHMHHALMGNIILRKT